MSKESRGTSQRVMWMLKLHLTTLPAAPVAAAATNPLPPPDAIITCLYSWKDATDRYVELFFL